MFPALTLPVVEAPARDLLAGLAAGTLVLTLDGELPVEHLCPGDRVITRDSGIAVLRAVEVEEACVATIRVKAGSLGHTRPDRDLRMGPGTLVHVRDWRAAALYGHASAMVPVARLADGEFVADEAPERQRLFRLCFDRPHVIYADGLEIGTAAA